MLIRLGAMAIALVCWGCSPSPQLDPTLYTPETAGLVRQSELVGQDYRVTFDDGRTLTFPADGNWIQGKKPRVDTVVVAGTKPVPWMFSADPQLAYGSVPAGCYAVLGGAKMNETHILQRVADGRAEVVIAFPKIGAWDMIGVYTDGSGDLAGRGTCINPLGQAFQWLN